MKTWRRNTRAIRLMSAKQQPTANRWARQCCKMRCQLFALDHGMGCVSKCDCDDRAVTGQYGERIYSLLSFHITPKACRIRRVLRRQVIRVQGHVECISNLGISSVGCRGQIANTRGV